MHFKFKDENGNLLTDVKVNPITKKVTFRNYTDDVYSCAFGVRKEVTYDEVLEFLEERTVPRNRADIKEILEELGLKRYDPYFLCRYFGGKVAHDNKYLEFL